uniref:Uncharacterized protein n=1 Tax=Octopus bimaculoides TaxID=37653 RepID=A0A0L8GN25_OCTBM
MMNKRRLRTDPWWATTPTQNSSLYLLPTLTLLTASLYMACTALTNHSPIPSFLIDHQIRERGTLSKAFSM